MVNIKWFPCRNAFRIIQHLVFCIFVFSRIPSGVTREAFMHSCGYYFYLIFFRILFVFPWLYSRRLLTFICGYTAHRVLSRKCTHARIWLSFFFFFFVSVFKFPTSLFRFLKQKRNNGNGKMRRNDRVRISCWDDT